MKEFYDVFFVEKCGCWIEIFDEMVKGVVCDLYVGDIVVVKGLFSMGVVCVVDVICKLGYFVMKLSKGIV